MEKLGLSGDTLLIKKNLVHKICETNQDRFIKNIQKQKSFKNEYIKSVPILVHDITFDGKNYIQMPYLQCGHAITWLSKATIEDLYNLEKILFGYFQSIINNSKKQIFDYKIWIDKINDLQLKIEDIDLQNILNELKIYKFKQLFYYGDYHGDLTLSNLLVSSSENGLEVDAIDFLESFINSPINDLVKIRQDTRHLWTLNLIHNFEKIDSNRVIILLNHMDEKFINFIKSDENINNFYLPFQILNFMRIIPYNRDAKVFNYLKNEIIRLFNEFDPNNVLCRTFNQISRC